MHRINTIPIVVYDCCFSYIIFDSISVKFTIHVYQLSLAVRLIAELRSTRRADTPGRDV